MCCKRLVFFFACAQVTMETNELLLLLRTTSGALKKAVTMIVSGAAS